MCIEFYLYLLPIDRGEEKKMLSKLNNLDTMSSLSLNKENMGQKELFAYLHSLYVVKMCIISSAIFFALYKYQQIFLNSQKYTIVN